ncbi:hypothetical protein [Actinomadura parmotrematis]|uniref:Translation initiation factor IF-2 n=1 Tax=Actinomadura parmotrematis TaxID=2864039 RepID=A0ABS7G313_9ACTN|nr:hypothetical protein [Actinomadura parmotrematis]MBW8486600.1 hypothetical protein [Actinomadura parmotrematis]
MTHSPEVLDSSTADPAPVFVDATGRRRRRLRLAGAVLGLACCGYAAMLGVSLAGGPVSPRVLLPLPGVPEKAAVGEAGPKGHRVAPSRPAAPPPARPAGAVPPAPAGRAPAPSTASAAPAARRAAPSSSAAPKPPPAATPPPPAAPSASPSASPTVRRRYGRGGQGTATPAPSPAASGTATPAAPAAGTAG